MEICGRHQPVDCGSCDEGYGKYDCPGISTTRNEAEYLPLVPQICSVSSATWINAIAVLVEQVGRDAIEITGPKKCSKQRFGPTWRRGIQVHTDPLGRNSTPVWAVRDIVKTIFLGRMPDRTVTSG